MKESERKRNGEASNCSTQGGASDCFERSEREGDAGGGPLPNGLPWNDGVAMVSQVRQDRGRATYGLRQPMDRNGAPRFGQVDDSNMVQSLQLSDLEQRNGAADRKICRW